MAVLQFIWQLVQQSFLELYDKPLKIKIHVYLSEIVLVH